MEKDWISALKGQSPEPQLENNYVDTNKEMHTSRTVQSHGSMEERVGEKTNRIYLLCDNAKGEGVSERTEA